MTHTVTTVLAEVTRLAPSLHSAGTFSARSLEALVHHASLAPIRHSVETGCGASTLLFSHISEHHTVFAVDAGTGSIRSIESSPLLRSGVLTLVEGPTQLTLPTYRFANRLQMALIDGPHGYPFPDLEYFYLYPQLDQGALLIVDDIHIPTITNLFDFLCADEMFDLQETVETTAFFRRTDAPTFPTTADGWWMQRYNKQAFDGAMPELMPSEGPDETSGRILFFLDRFGTLMPVPQHGQLRLAHDESLVVAGWAIDVDRRRAASAVDLILDGKRYRTPVRGFRSDVATAHGDRAYLRSGFNAQFPPGFVTRGSHELDIRVVTGDGHRNYPATRLVFDVF